MTVTDRKAYIGIHGWSGAGKSWLASSAPGPRLVLEAEMGVFDTVHHPDHTINIKLWNPLTEPVPEDLTPDDSVVVSIRDLSKIRPIMQLLESGNHQFETVIVDSFTEIQAMLKTIVASPGEEYDPNATFDMQAWGRLKNHGGILLRDLRDLTWPDAVKPINAVVVMFSDDETIPSVPLLEGGIRKAMFGWFDIVGYLFTAAIPDTLPIQKIRVMQIERDATAMAKCRPHLVKVKHGSHVESPDLTEIINTLNGGNS